MHLVPHFINIIWFTWITKTLLLTIYKPMFLNRATMPMVATPPTLPALYIAIFVPSTLPTLPVALPVALPTLPVALPMLPSETLGL